MSDDAWEFGDSDGLSLWPILKVARSREHAYQLEARIGLWNARGVYKCPLRIGDRPGHLEIVQAELPETPEVEWGLIFGNAIHDARVALDALAWELAHVDGAEPADPASVTFPVTETEEKFRRAIARNYSHLPTNAVQRMREVQPFQIENPEESWLRILSMLDNWDKHRGAVFTAPDLDAVELRLGGLTFGDDELAGVTPGFGWQGPTNTVEVGDPIGWLVLDRPIANLQASAHAVIHVNAVVDLVGRALVPASRLAWDIADWVEEALRYIGSGTLPKAGSLPVGPTFEPPPASD